MRIAVHHINKVQMGRARHLVIVEVSIVDSVATIMDIRVINDPVLHGPIVIIIVIGGAGGHLTGGGEVNPRCGGHCLG